MGELFTRLTNLINFSNTAAVTGPGLVAAAGLVLALMPSPASDFFYEPEQANPCRFEQKPLDPEPFSLRGRSKKAAGNLTKLENSRDALQQCILEFTSKVSQDEEFIAVHKDEIEVRVRERGAFEKKYLSYVESRGSLTDEYRNGFNARNLRIQSLRGDVLAKQREARTNQLNVDRLKARLEVVKERLGDPTRARPASGVPEFFDSLTSKVAAFVLLAMVLGFALDPINRGVFGFAFELVGRWFFNLLRANRFYVYRIR